MAPIKPINNSVLGFDIPEGFRKAVDKLGTIVPGLGTSDTGSPRDVAKMGGPVDGFEDGRAEKLARGPASVNRGVGRGLPGYKAAIYGGVASGAAAISRGEIGKVADQIVKFAEAGATDVALYVYSKCFSAAATMVAQAPNGLFETKKG
ncbi:MAG: hypothetical protein HYV02_00215 [Deltaproteobacteria bacterium]|nr:hypothetical protein [Deltaproteobacteria bacterium]